MDQIPVVTQIVSEKMVDVVGDAVAPVIAVVTNRSAWKKTLSSFLKALFLRCIHTTAVQVVPPPRSGVCLQAEPGCEPPPTPPLKPEPVKEEKVVDELPPLEPNPEKV